MKSKLHSLGDGQTLMWGEREPSYHQTVCVRVCKNRSTQSHHARFCIHTYMRLLIHREPYDKLGKCFQCSFKIMFTPAFQKYLLTYIFI